MPLTAWLLLLCAVISINVEEPLRVPKPALSSIPQSFAWAERRLHRAHFSARFPSLSHLSLQDYYTSLILVSPLPLNKASGEARRIMAAYMTHISLFCFSQ